MRARAIVVATVLGTSLASGGWLLGRGFQGSASGPPSAQLFDAVAAHVKRYYVDSMSDSVLYDKAVLGLLQELDDPYTLYLTPERVRRLTEATRGNYVGIGAQVQRRDNWPMVITPFPGSPAERAGLHTGDRIVEIDGRATQGWTVEETNRALRGPEETVVRVVIERPGSPRRLSFNLTRGGIHRRSVARKLLLDDGVGYVDVNIFNDSTEHELLQAIDSLTSRGMRSLIVDLRGNPGGVLTQGVGVADMFLTAGQLIVTMRGRTPEMNQKYVATSTQRWPVLPLVVLIDQGSASAAEIVAGALQDHDRALLVGHTSFGKGSAQAVLAVSTGGAVRLTTARWYTPSGRSIDRPHRSASEPLDSVAPGRTFRTARGRIVYGGGGIVPDVVAGDTALGPADRALESALGSRVIDFRDAMTAYAITLRTSGTIRQRDFAVTPAMLDGLWSTMRARGFSFERRVFDGAAALVSRLLAREIARYVFGPAAEAERSARDDDVIVAAARLAAGVASTEQLLERARRRLANARPAN
jgi:carboxyl-terminal processing protease